MIPHQAILIAALFALATDISAAEQDEQSKDPTPRQMQAELDQSCQAGEAQACLDLGNALQQRHDLTGEQTAELATRAFDQACELGSCSGCLMMGDDDRVVHVCVAPCEAGDQRACFGLMGVHRYGKSADSHPEQAARWAERYLALVQAACDRGEPQACFQLSVDITIGFPDIPTDQDAGRVAVAQAEIGLDRQCRGGHVGACAQLTALHIYVKNLARRLERQTGEEPRALPTAGLDYACRTLRRDCAAGTRSSCRAFSGPPCQPRQ